MSDNGPQYSSKLFSVFAKSYGFFHQTSSPLFPQANGAAERAVQTIKSLLGKNDDPYLAMIAYRSTPLENGYSPAQLSMGRNIRTTLPVIQKQLVPNLPKHSYLREKEKKLKLRQKQNYDSLHGARSLPELKQGGLVWIPDRGTEATVSTPVASRSYAVTTPDGSSLRRNRRGLIPIPDQEKPPERIPEQPQSEAQSDLSTQNSTNQSENVIRTRSGRISKPPDRYGCT